MSAPATASATLPRFSPLYRQIRVLLVEAIARGEWKPGEAIASEGQLAQRFQVSQGTVRKAIDELSSDNLLVRRQGKGTFVATHTEERARYRFLRLVADGGDAGDDTPPPMRRRLLDCRRLRPPAAVARALALAPGEAAFQVRRLLIAAEGGTAPVGQPVVLDDLWLPAVPFKGLSAERLAAYTGTLYGFFEAEFGVRMLRADEKLRAVAAPPEAAVLLGVAIGAPLLEVERVSRTFDDRPVEWRRGLYRTEHHHYRNALV
jgi:GntR family transcriptional regulator